jgi:tripartite-type tricarboxylate transporter receptor subunit TctC
MSGAAWCSVLVRAVVTIMFVVFSASALLAEDAYPNQPVKIVVGMPAGSFTDLSARWMADELKASLGSTFVVENRPGAATNIASGVVARAPNNGYTLLLATNSNTMNPSLFKELPFDVVKDFTPVAMIAKTPFLLVVRPTLPVANVKELIAYAKANPGKLNIAATGKGTATHLAIAMFAQQTGISVQTIFYKGSVDAVTDVISGRVDATLSPISTAMPQIKAGNLKVLAITSAQRSDLVPDIPTTAESGVPGYEAAMWTGLFAPAGTPANIIGQLSTAATHAVASPEMQARIKTSGGDPVVMDADKFKVFVHEDIDRWAAAVKASDIKPE